MCWQKYGECTADINFALCSHVPAVAIYDMFDDGEAKPCAGLARGGRKGSEQILGSLVRQAGAGVREDDFAIYDRDFTLQNRTLSLIHI